MLLHETQNLSTETQIVCRHIDISTSYIFSTLHSTKEGCLSSLPADG